MKFPSFVNDAYDDLFTKVDSDKLRISESIIDSSQGTKVIGLGDILRESHGD